MGKLHGGRRKTLKKKGTKLRRYKKVRFNTTSKLPKRHFLRKKQRGGSIITDLMRGAESGLKNTIDTFKGVPLSPSPFPTQDQPIDRNTEVI